MTKPSTSSRKLLLLTVALLIVAGQVGAVDVYLVAGPVDVTMTDGNVVPMWGYGLEPDNDFTTLEATPQVPGPRLDVPVGDTAVNIYLYNNLTVPVSIIIPGQIQATSVVRIPWNDADYGAPASTGGRIRSFTAETAPGTSQLYSWTGFRPGTFLYKSGTHQQVQVPMGLYGPITQSFALGQVYDGIAFDNEVVLLYSQVNPDLATAATTPGGYGPSGTMMTSTLHSVAKYFLVNGQSYSTAVPLEYSAGAAGQSTLLRFLNASSETVMPTLFGETVQLLAEDGFPYIFPFTQYTVTLPAGKTEDVLFQPVSGGIYPLIDRTLRLTNAAAPDGGYQLKLMVSADPNLPAGTPDSVTLAEDTSTSVPASGVLANDAIGGGPGPLTATLVQTALHGLLTLNPDGSFDYTPDADYFGADLFLYTASDGTFTSDTIAATLVITPIDDPPITVADALTIFEDLPLSLPAPGLLANDIDVDGDTLTAVLHSQPTNGMVSLLGNGSLIYAPATNFNGPDSFQYEATDAFSGGGIVTVTVSVTAVNDPPVALGESYAVISSPLTVAAPGVLMNDSDVEGSPLTATLVTAPFHGALALNPNGSFVYTPDPGYMGSDHFRYKPNDGSLDGVAVRVGISVFPIFFSGFETGDLSEWSSNSP